MRTFWTTEEKELLNVNYENATNEELIALFPTRSWDAIKLMAGKLKLKRYYNISRQSSASILLKETPTAYYWLGFLMADGYFSKSRIKLSLANLDVNHLELFGKFLGCKVNRYKINSVVTLMDTKYIPLIKEKFEIDNQKTYNPCNISNILNRDLLISLVIGFIDGDGSIGYVHKRKDVNLRVKCHAVWLNNLQIMCNAIYNLSNENPINTKINTQGYANFTISNNTVIRALKQKALDLKLPIMVRKWDKINITQMSRYKTSKIQRDKVLDFIRNNPSLKATQVAKMMSVSDAYVSVLKHKYS